MKLNTQKTTIRVEKSGRITLNGAKSDLNGAKSDLNPRLKKYIVYI